MLSAADERIPSSERPGPLISAVVVNFNGGEKLGGCLAALIEQTYSLDEIIVVDNGSDDTSLQRLRDDFVQVQVIELRENRGLPAGRNVGLRRAKGGLVLFVDVDVYLAKDCLAVLVKVYREAGPAVICPRILLAAEPDVVQCDGAAAHFVGTMVLRHGYRSVAEAPLQCTTVGGCIGACFLVDRAAALKANGFNEDFFLYFEDHEFCVRMRSLGYRFICEPASVAFHDRGQGTPGMAFRGHGIYPRERAFQTMRGRVAIMLIHYRLRTLFILAPLLLIYELICIAVAVRGGWSREWFRAWAWQFRNRRTLYLWRQSMQELRQVNDQDLLVGGPIPLAPGFVRTRWGSAVVTCLSSIFDWYWKLTRNWIH